VTAYNVVRFRVKPGFEEQFIEAHRKAIAPFKGFLGADLVKTGDRTYCFVGRWGDFQDIVEARAQMIALLNSFRDMLEDLGNGMGVTDPISGSSVVRLGPPEVAKKRAAKPKPKPKPKAARKPKAKAKAKKTAKAKRKS
jgi:hypothetical protein